MKRFYWIFIHTFALGAMLGIILRCIEGNDFEEVIAWGIAFLWCASDFINSKRNK